MRGWVDSLREGGKEGEVGGREGGREGAHLPGGLALATSRS